MSIERKIERNLSFRPGNRASKAVRRKMIAMIVRAKAQRYRESLVDQFNSGKPVSVPPELKTELDALNEPYVAHYRGNSRIPQV